MYHVHWNVPCQCGFYSVNKCTTLLGDVDNGGGYTCMGAGGTGKISVLSPQLFCEPKTALKI